MFLLIVLTLLFPANPSGSANLTQEFRERDQALLDAIAPGNAKIRDDALAPDAVYVDENGTILNRADFMKQLTPLPSGASGTLSIISYSARQSGDVVSVIHTDDEQELYHGQKLHAQYLMTETWQQQGGKWKLLLVHAIFCSAGAKDDHLAGKPS
jgi:ketosteroid isomerase-like protein